MYDNSFARWLDDMDKRGDYTLNHYYSKEGRDAGFLKVCLRPISGQTIFLSGLHLRLVLSCRLMLSLVPVL